MKGGFREYFLLIIFNILLLLINRSLSNAISSGLSSIILTVSRIGDGVSSIYEEVAFKVETIVRAREALKENRELKKTLMLMRLENLKLKQILEREDTCKTFRGKRWKFVVARVIRLNPENMRIRFYIDSGTRDGIREYLPVVDLNGNVVGKTVEPIGYSYAGVEPITNPYSAIGARIKEGIGVLRGTGERLTFLDYIYITRYPHKGEPVYTSGLDEIFPEGLLIGKILRVQKGKYIFLRVEVKPAFTFKTLKYVGVILKW